MSGELVRRGFAEVVTLPPNVGRRAELLALQREAQAARAGLWAEADALRAYRPTPSGVLASRRTMSFFHVDDVKGLFEADREEFDSPEAAVLAGYAPSFDYAVHLEREQRMSPVWVGRLDAARAALPVVVMPLAPGSSPYNVWRGGVVTPVYRP